MRNKELPAPMALLIACQDVEYGMTLARFMESPALRIERCHDMAGLLRLVSRSDFDALVLDLELDNQGDIDLVSFVRQRNPVTRMILLFDMEQMEAALDGIRMGAFFYLPKSSPPSDVALAVNKALENRTVAANLDAYEQTVFEELAGRTDAMRRVIELIRKVAPTDSTVLLLGESGSGKEVVAQTLHRLSPRRDKPFVAINCAALPESLLESELFGHVRGAFTGATDDKCGLFESADGGALFLDEIGDMSPITQAKLLRVLQNGEIRRVGSTSTIRVDVRIIAATNRDLLDAVNRLAFREDLYYRLNVVQIRIPPLRERMDALPALVNHFIARFNARFAKQVRGVDNAAAQYLRQYPFPGNVRELESIIAHSVIMADGDEITASDLPDYVRHGLVMRPALTYQKEDGIPTLAEMEARHIRYALDVLKGNQSNAAKKLGISRSTLWRKMREYNITVPSEETDDS
ncbi:MAG TPA: sigma-54-dependent Fis family transcriptional regulator [Candidatus Hydrogenedentes bacterium]|nr:sigma-54-dependent Fis family transcriptional regulator [Candidatus Hydrogenedentota bacterium]